MESIAGLLERDATIAVQHFGGHFFTAVGGEAVHYPRVRWGQGQKFVVHLVGSKLPQPLVAFGFLPHARPDIGVHDVRRFNRMGGGPVLKQAPLGHPLTIELKERIVESVAVRSGQDEVHPELAAADRQRASDIVPVANERNRPPGELAKHLLHGEEIGQCLTGVIVVRKAVDDGAGGVFCERFHRLMAETFAKPMHRRTG